MVFFARCFDEVVVGPVAIHCRLLSLLFQVEHIQLATDGLVQLHEVGVSRALNKKRMIFQGSAGVQHRVHLPVRVGIGLGNDPEEGLPDVGTLRMILQLHDQNDHNTETY